MGRNSQRRRNTKRSRVLPVDDEMAAILERQQARFREKFGREMGPTDPIFFDPDADNPKMMDEDVVNDAMLEALRASGMPPALTYATMRTGMIVTEENLHLFSEEDLAEWQAALDEYAELEKRGTSN